MAITNYSELQTAIATWAERTGDSDFVTRTVDCIALAEARLNRELGALEADTTLTGTLNSRRLTTGLTITEPLGLWLAQSGYDEEPIQLQPDGSFPYETTSGKPTVAAFDEGGTYIDFSCPLDTAYPFRLHYRGRIALASVSTNWLLTYHPDVYLAASMMWGAGYREDWENGAAWKSVLDSAIPEIKGVLAQQRRGMLRVDPALSSIGRRPYFNHTTGQ